MNDVFEDFVWAALGDELRTTSSRRLPLAARSRGPLDEDSKLRPEPDLSLWYRSAVRVRRRREVQGDDPGGGWRPVSAAGLLCRHRSRPRPPPIRREAQRPSYHTESCAEGRACASDRGRRVTAAPASRQDSAARKRNRSDGHTRAGDIAWLPAPAGQEAEVARIARSNRVHASAPGPVVRMSVSPHSREHGRAVDSAPAGRTHGHTSRQILDGSHAVDNPRP